MTKIDINIDTKELSQYLSNRIINVLKSTHIDTLKDICMMERRSFANLSNVGAQSLDEMDNFLHQFDLHFGMGRLEIAEYQQEKTPDLVDQVMVEQLLEEKKYWEEKRIEIIKALIQNPHRCSNPKALVMTANNIIRELRETPVFK